MIELNLFQGMLPARFSFLRVFFFWYDFLDQVNFSALLYVLMSGILTPPFDALCIAVDVFILSCFLSHTNSKHSFWTSLINLSRGLGSMIHRYTNLDRINDFSTATHPSGVIVHFAHILNRVFLPLKIYLLCSVLPYQISCLWTRAPRFLILVNSNTFFDGLVVSLLVAFTSKPDSACFFLNSFHVISVCSLDLL